MQGETKAAGYVRVSTQGQAEHGLGLEIQREAITAHCSSAGMALVDIYEDAGVSGANGVEDRNGWPLLMDGLSRREFSHVVVLRLDRLARDLMLQENMLSDVEASGGLLVSIDEPDLCDGDPTRTMFRQIKGAISQYEKAMIVARLRAGRIRKKQNGGYASGFYPFGYDLIGTGRESHLVVNDAEAEIVRWIYRARAEGWSTPRIAKQLNDSAVPTKRNCSWSPTTVRTILLNERYLGRPGDGVPPILSEAEVVASRGVS